MSKKGDVKKTYTKRLKDIEKHNMNPKIRKEDWKNSLNPKHLLVWIQLFQKVILEVKVKLKLLKFQKGQR